MRHQFGSALPETGPPPGRDPSRRQLIVRVATWSMRRRNTVVIGWLAAIASWILVAHYFDVHWLVGPAGRPDTFPLHWLDLAALLCVGGLSASAGLLSLRGRRLVPIHDPRLAEAIAYHST